MEKRFTILGLLLLFLTPYSFAELDKENAVFKARVAAFLATKSKGQTVVAANAFVEGQNAEYLFVQSLTDVKDLLVLFPDWKMTKDLEGRILLLLKKNAAIFIAPLVTQGIKAAVLSRGYQFVDQMIEKFHLSVDNIIILQPTSTAGTFIHESQHWLDFEDKELNKRFYAQLRRLAKQTRLSEDEISVLEMPLWEWRAHAAAVKYFENNPSKDSGTDLRMVVNQFNGIYWRDLMLTTSKIKSANLLAYEELLTFLNKFIPAKVTALDVKTVLRIEAE